MRSALNVAYALIVDNDLGDDRFEVYDRQLVNRPEIDEETPEESTEPTGRWDPETWGTTPEAQEQLLRALEFIGA